jgi:hypothetical protein
MAQVRDAAFNPSSPRSSSGAADSYKHDATPETRLTIFSPNDESARCNKATTAVGLGGPSDQPVRFPVKPVEAFADASAAADRDPFVSSTTVIKTEQKLSPTASAFRPLSVPVVARGSLNVLPGPNAGFGANRQLFAPQPQATAKFSDELGLSRCVVLWSPSRPINIPDAEGYLAVRLPQPLLLT